MRPSNYSSQGSTGAASSSSMGTASGHSQSPTRSSATRGTPSQSASAPPGLPPRSQASGSYSVEAGRTTRAAPPARGATLTQTFTNLRTQLYGLGDEVHRQMNAGRLTFEQANEYMQQLREHSDSTEKVGSLVARTQILSNPAGGSWTPMQTHLAAEASRLAQDTSQHLDRLAQSAQSTVRINVKKAVVLGAPAGPGAAPAA